MHIYTTQNDDLCILNLFIYGTILALKNTDRNSFPYPPTETQ